METLRKFWQKLESLHPAFKAAEGIAVIAVINFGTLMIAGVWPASDIAYISFILGLVISSLVFLVGVLPHIYADFDPEPINRGIDAFGEWFWGWGLVLSGIVVAMMYLSVLIIG